VEPCFLKEYSSFENSKDHFPFRIPSDALDTLKPFLSDKRAVNATEDDLLTLLRSSDAPLIKDLSESTQAQLTTEQMKMVGSFVLRFTPTEEVIRKGRYVYILMRFCARHITLLSVEIIVS
jgi:hypothetical protein